MATASFRSSIDHHALFLQFSSTSSTSSDEIRSPAKFVRFHDMVTVALTYPKDDYDRSSAPVQPLSKEDVSEVLRLRLQMQRQSLQMYHEAYLLRKEVSIGTSTPASHVSYPSFTPMNTQQAVLSR
ncbi:hypothetical protein SeMB42_g06291 [Synchytrium endobioticum]|uniref:Uncharacterized protein n=1 Tax=Synchytrium endobioticum TaxID=286115 RepID=A0A507CLN4_9FUNG|nr:hypothetical protein SeMB42_g06291 [Synchytrium endobioticum]TPX43480.1 hypothetical protein SeLEV6574_g05041 [Synchytrium endobioticum]